MIAVRVLVWSIIGAAAFALLGSWGHALYFARTGFHEGPFFLLGGVGAIVGAIASASQSIVEQMRNNQTGDSGSSQP